MELFAPIGTILSNNVALCHVWICLPFGQSYRDLGSCDQELTHLGVASADLVMLKPGDLGLSHLLGIYTWTISEISNAELLAQGKETSEGMQRLLDCFFHCSTMGLKGKENLGKH